jgi:alcohol dehydrogenase (cytochrome c)
MTTSYTKEARSISTGLFASDTTNARKALWQFNSGSGIHGQAMSYSVNGRRYVAISTGWGGWMKRCARLLQGSETPV